jgi:hypothetical protein
MEIVRNILMRAVLLCLPGKTAAADEFCCIDNGETNV